MYIYMYNMYISRCLRQTATHPCGRTHRFRSKILEKVSPRGLKATKLGPKIHQVGLQNPPSWAPKSRKISLGRTLEGSWGHLGPKSRPRPKYTSKTNFWGPSWGPILEAKNLPKSIF